MPLVLPCPAGVRLVVALFLLVPTISSAQLIDSGQCMAVEDPLERLSCFESLVRDARATGGQGRAPEGVASEQPAVQRPAPPAAPVEAPLASPRASQAPAEESREAEEYTGTIARASLYDYNRWHIVLENGQQWRQMVDRRYPLREGYTVRIYPTGFGNSFRLSAREVSGYIQVEPVR